MSTLRRRAEAAPPAETSSEPADVSPLSDRLGFWLRMAQQTAFESFHKAMAPLGLSPGRLGVLLLLEAAPDMRQTALGAALRVKPPNLAVLLAAMEQDGLIRRVDDPQNRRVNLLRLTPAGRALLKRAKTQEAQVEVELTQGFTAEEREALVAALRRIARA